MAIWFKKVQLKIPGVASYKRRFVLWGTAALPTNPHSVKSLSDSCHKQMPTTFKSLDFPNNF